MRVRQRVPPVHQQQQPRQHSSRVRGNGRGTEHPALRGERVSRQFQSRIRRISWKLPLWRRSVPFWQKALEDSREKYHNETKVLAHSTDAGIGKLQNTYFIGDHLSGKEYGIKEVQTFFAVSNDEALLAANTVMVGRRERGLDFGKVECSKIFKKKQKRYF
ncbi:hypothetical protein CDAR_7371 [Caerostris darwini]|uniref:Uncharacterized protein n=1 Tax=Caerostris darwini TaxID=1538125 RepID=A0AAV4RQZ3_9ARAC|nr:hypothetical protein CDAR_7371 [Caerostris darwini]